MASEVIHPTRREHMSFSQVQLAAQCGEAYRRKYIEGAASGPENLPAMAGSAFHAAAEGWETAYFRSDVPTAAAIANDDVWWSEQVELLEVMTKKALNESLDAYDGELITYGNQDLRFWRKEKIKGLAQTYLDYRRVEFERGFDWFGAGPEDSVEVECRAEIGGFPFLGMIDMIFLDSKGRTVIRDLKTGESKGFHVMQLEQYRLALKRAHGVEAAYGQLLYVKRSKPYLQVIDWNLEDGEIDEMVARVRANVEGNTLMVNGPFTGHCAVCDFSADCPWGDVTAHGSS